MSVIYEWIVEVVEDGEIIDTDYFSSYANAASAASRLAADGDTTRIALMRDHPRDGRGWAYVAGCVMPKTFSDASGAQTHSVPQRFLLEHARG